MDMNQVSCALCDTVITNENNAEEHVIPNAIGGKKKVKGFICKKCNNKSGEKWESELANQLNSLSVFFDIKRDRKKPPDQTITTVNGVKYHLHHDGVLKPVKPIYSKTQTGKGINVHIEARSEEQAQQLIKRVKSEHPDLNVEVLNSQICMEPIYCPDKFEISFEFGGHDVGRSIVKSALSLVVEAGVSHTDCEHALPYIRNQSDKACFGYYYTHDIILDRPVGIPLHCVYVVGKPDKKQILGYVEFFGIYRIVLCLSSCYEGFSFKNSYSINPMSGEKLDLDFCLQLTEHEIQAVYDYHAYSVEKQIEAVNLVMPTGQKKDFDNELARVYQRVIEHVNSNISLNEDEEPTVEQLREIKRLIREQIEPFIQHQMRCHRSEIEHAQKLQSEKKS